MDEAAIQQWKGRNLKIVDKIHTLNSSPDMEIRGVVLVGDLTQGKSYDNVGEWLDHDEWLTFQGIYEDHLQLPLYVGLGNHDLHNPGKSVAFRHVFPRVLSYLEARHCNVQPFPWSPVAAVPATNFHLGEMTWSVTIPSYFHFNGSHSYAWDWEGLHLVQLHRFGGDDLTTHLHHEYVDTPGYEITPVLPWLRAELQGTSSPVILFQHYDWKADDDWWTSCHTNFPEGPLEPCNWQ